MPESETEPDNDPWMTIAEIAEELRLSPATVRSWVSQGRLPATRAGRRKWLIRRSDIDRMTSQNQLEYVPGHPDYELLPETIETPRRSPDWHDRAREHVSAKGWVGLSETFWRKALERSRMAPPDAGFAARLELIANASARKAAALNDLDQEPGPWWQRQGALVGGALTYELRPGANRPGPDDLWVKFDAIVQALSVAMESHSALAELEALEQLSLILHEIVDALVEDGLYPQPELRDYYE